MSKNKISRQRKWQIKNYEKWFEQRRKYRQKNKKKLAAYMREWRKKKKEATEIKVQSEQ